MEQITLSGIDKVYRTGKVEYQALIDVSLSIQQGEFVAIVGPSGSGKTTILNMITGIDRPAKGNVIVDKKKIARMSENRLARWRGRNIGIVFQFFQLFPTLSAQDNAMLPMDFAGFGRTNDRRTRARKNLELVGLGDKLKNLPSELSGGEQQRVAIARALANDPPIIIGDEPTGNLDTRIASRMFDIFKTLKEQGKTIIFVTHNRELARKVDRRIRILDGRVFNGDE